MSADAPARICTDPKRPTCGSATAMMLDLVPRPLRNVLSITHGGASIFAAELPVDFGVRLVDDSVPGTSFGS